MPDNRDEHTANVYEGTLILFGGFVKGERTNTMYRYYFKENKWEEVKYLGHHWPCPRAGHSASIIGDQLIVIGGKDEENQKLMDVWSYDFTMYQWTELRPEGPVPLPRSGHSSCIYKDFVVVFGGIHEVTQEMNDLVLFDIKNIRWLTFFEE